MITAIARLHAQPGKEAEVQKALEQMIEGVQTHEPGVDAYSLHVAENDPSEFLLYERYPTVADFEQHQKTEHMLELGTALRESLREPIAIERYTYLKGL